MSAKPSDFDSSFGTYALPAWREAIRQVGRLWPGNKLGLILASATRRIALMGHSRGLEGPFDVAVAGSIKARLFPASNRCEKRAFCGVQTWDAPERSFLMEQAEQKKDFVFVDVGANVGLYSLFMADRAGANTPTIIAIEPDPENRARLTFNARHSRTDITIEAVAVSGEAGTGVLGESEGNRGGIALQEQATIGGTKVPLEPLISILDRNGIDHVDAMKVDIEGHDLVALTAFFRDAEPSLYPHRLLVEIERDATTSPLIDLALDHGYKLAGLTRLNAMLERLD